MERGNGRDGHPQGRGEKREKKKKDRNESTSLPAFLYTYLSRQVRGVSEKEGEGKKVNR